MAALRRTQEWELPFPAQLELVIDTDPRAALRIANGAETVDDWRSVLGDDRIGLFINAAPAALHVEPTIDAAQSGTHVLCEVPLGRDSAECQVLYRACEDAGVTHMCGSPLRFLPPLRMAQELLASGELGDVWHVRGSYLRSIEAAEDSDSAGVVARIGPELVDICRYLFGEIDGMSAVGRRFGVDETAARRRRHGGGVRLRRDRDVPHRPRRGTHRPVRARRRRLARDAGVRRGRARRPPASTATGRGCAGSRRPRRRTRRAGGGSPTATSSRPRDAQALELAHLLTAISERGSVGSGRGDVPRRVPRDAPLGGAERGRRRRLSGLLARRAWRRRPPGRVRWAGSGKDAGSGRSRRLRARPRTPHEVVQRGLTAPAAFRAIPP